MNVPITIIKATGLSLIIFWTIAITEDFSLDMIPLVLLSVIPISICCSLTICLTIAPFFWSKKGKRNLETVYNSYFPFYAIALFGLCVFSTIESNFNTYGIAFNTSAFFTALKTWSWLAEPKKIK
ncbi:hypothetical protein SAMN05428642_102911 [Flaviramulus basaltis]|uniref:Uncharacterized protein n=1 Tax=Flaviramulus basaltis TaxID=369401 RepID=A0A1K2IKG0_9FLAO|nr:hypothetical protein [Flaviramulus basaltis]SFZ92712.1 hypothetical protein SAMN05428642_102911 [Flaviramulus basaltis]